MKILGQVAFFLLLLGAVCCQNNVNRNAKSSSNKPSKRVVSQPADTAVVQPSSSEDRPSRRVVSQAADTVVQPSASEDSSKPSRRVVSQPVDATVVQPSASEDRPSRRVVSQPADASVVQRPSASEDNSHPPRPEGAPDAVRPRAEGTPEAGRPRAEAAISPVPAARSADTGRPRAEGTPEAGRPRPEAAAGGSILPSGREGSSSVPAARSADAGRPRAAEAGREREREGTSPVLSSGREGGPVPGARPAEARREGGPVPGARPEGSPVPAGARSEGAAGREGNQNPVVAARPAGQQQSNTDMRLHFLKNTQVTCNDGTAAGFYLKEFRGSRRWIIFLEGGWCCYNRETCDSRYQNIPRLMSSSAWPQTRTGSGILSSQAEENPHWHNTNIVFIPYCSSDVWSGTGPSPSPPRQRQGRDKEKQRDASGSIEYTFMGSLIIHEVIQDLIPKGIKLAKVVMLTGTSAGGTGVLLNIEKVSTQLQQLGAEAQVRGLVDSGWFLESKRQRVPGCPATVSCSPEDAIKKGLRLWNGVVPNRCRQLYKRGEEWQCFFGHRLYSTLTSPLFVVQWLFDEEQLRVENIYLGAQSLSEEQWTYMRNLGREIKSSLRDVTAVFAPSCLSHTLITKSNWLTFQVRGTSLPRALQCWDRSLLQEANRSAATTTTTNNRTVLKGCPFHLLDTCLSPHCNPTCPALVHQATRQELTLVQMLVAMGVDLQRLGLDPQRDAGSLASVVLSNGG